MWAVVVLTSTKPHGHRPAKTSRIELRATEDDRDLLDRAAAALGTDRSSFLLVQEPLAAQRVLADREHFLLDADAQQEWERINSRPARSLPGLVRLLDPLPLRRADRLAGGDGQAGPRHRGNESPRGAC